MFRGDNLWTLITGGGISALAFLIGGFDQLVTACFIFIFIDLATGVLKAIVQKDLVSRQMYMGLARKAGYIFFIILAVQLDIISGSGGHMVRDGVIFFIVGVEGLSIIENLGALGIPIPAFVKNTLQRLKDDNSGDKQLENKDK